jgi:hypothetical protein
MKWLQRNKKKTKMKRQRPPVRDEFYRETEDAAHTIAKIQTSKHVVEDWNECHTATSVS